MKGLKSGQFINFNDGVNYSYGFVRGFASVELPVVGRLVIIEYLTVLSISENKRVTDEFPCIAAQECFIY